MHAYLCKLSQLYLAIITLASHLCKLTKIVNAAHLEGANLGCIQNLQVSFLKGRAASLLVVSTY